MEFRPHVKPYKFFPDYERMEPLILDHTAIITAKQCLRKYFFQIVLGSVGRGQQPIYFAFGSAYHKFREVLEISYQKLDLKGMNIVEVERQQKLCFVDAYTAATNYYDKATGGREPDVKSKFEFMTRARLIQTCAEAFRVWQREKAQGKIIVLAIEQPFNVEFTSNPGEFTSGRFDQIVRWNGKIYGRDFKTSSKEGMYYDRTLDPNDQFTRYTFAEQKLAGQRCEGQIIEVAFNSKSKGPIIETKLATRTQWQLDDWERDEAFHRDTLNRARELDVWPKSEVSCTFCQFHSVCKMGSEGSQMAKLKAEFTQKPWDNMTVHLVDD